MTHALITAVSAPGIRPDGPHYDKTAIIVCITVLVALVVFFAAWAWLSRTRRTKRALLHIEVALEFALAVIIGGLLVTAAPFVANVALPESHDERTSWTKQVEQWAADTYGVQAGADQFAISDFGFTGGVRCISSLTGPCYEATLMFAGINGPGRVEKVQLGYPNGIPTLVSVQTGQPITPVTGEREPLVKLGSKDLGVQLAERYGLAGKVDVTRWSTGQSKWDYLVNGSSRIRCSGDSFTCATGSVLGRDGLLHSVALVSVDGVYGILVDPATGIEFGRSGSGS